MDALYVFFIISNFNTYDVNFTTNSNPFFLNLYRVKNEYLLLVGTKETLPSSNPREMNKQINYVHP